MMSYGYRPEWSEGAIKPPIFQTSTFAFNSAGEGKEFFAWAYGLAERDPARPMGLIYSRLNNPNLEMVEQRLNLWDRAEASAVFSWGWRRSRRRCWPWCRWGARWCSAARFTAAPTT